MNLSFINELIERAPEYAPAEIEETRVLAEKALKQLRTLLFDLRPVILETQGLIPALELYTERLRETDELNINLIIEHEFERLSTKAEIAIFAVIQEAVNNARKYAQGGQIDLTLRTDQDRLIVSVKDDGQGFDVHGVSSSYDKRGSLGMINMQERAEAVSGIFKIYSEVGRGTEVTLSLPLAENLLTNAERK
jgi:signal transduction histidine kinase